MADFNHNNHEDSSLLHLAVIEENMDVVKFLLKHGVSANNRAPNKQLSLEFLSDAEHQKYAEVSLASAIQDNTSVALDEDQLDPMITKTTTPLHLAARSENREIAELLIHHGAEVNVRMEGGETPLIIAVLSKRQNLVDLLLDHGADVNAETLWGKSAIHYAAQTGQKVILETLLKRGGHVNATTYEGLTPLHIAAEAGQKESVATLLKHGADVDIKTKKGATVLHYAAVMGHSDIVELVLGHGADINVIMKHGGLDLSPFAWITAAEEKKTWELVARYTNKMSIVNWYNTFVMKLYKKSKDRKSLFHADTEQH